MSTLPYKHVTNLSLVNLALFGSFLYMSAFLKEYIIQK